eukprot:s1442_g9.t1
MARSTIRCLLESNQYHRLCFRARYHLKWPLLPQERPTDSKGCASSRKLARVHLQAWQPCSSLLHCCVQGRTILGKILFWKREAGRFVLRMGAHASKGWMEALMVAGAAFSFLVLVVLLGMCLITCCNALFSDEEPDVAAAAAKLKKRQ